MPKQAEQAVAQAVEQAAAEYPPETLSRVARSLAQSHSPTSLTRGGRREPSLPFPLDADFDRVFDTLAGFDEATLDRAPGVELLIENDYVIRQALALVQDHTPDDRYRQLPRLRDAPRQGELRAIVVADEVLNVCGAPLDLSWARDFLGLYQRDAELALGELWALPNLLRMLVLQRLLQSVRSALEQADEGTAAEHDYGAAISGMLLSLRALAAEDWVRWVESVSVVHQILSVDPAGAYTGMDRDTRNRYRTRVEVLARRARQAESTVARHAIGLAEAQDDSGAGAAVWDDVQRRRHVGYYLVDEGAWDLLAAVNRRRVRFYGGLHWLQRRADVAYLAGIFAVAGALMWHFVGQAWPGAAPVERLIGVPAAFVLLLTVAVHVVNRLVNLVVPPRTLPKMDFRSGVPAEFPTVVAIPALLGSREEVRRLLYRLETSFLGNRDPAIRYALLTDPPDADELTCADDEALLALAVDGIRRLNARHGGEGEEGGADREGDEPAGGPFFLFHRPRQWNEREGCYMAWERKRGKLEAFNALLLGDEQQRVHLAVGDGRDLDGVRFVITLDADTQLVTGVARNLIGTLAHPLNRPVTDPDSGSVLHGYSVIQPRVEVDPDAAGRNAFTRAMAGDVVLDLYTHAVSDVYQDLLGVGIYTGKGIYDVRAFEASLEGRVPTDSILSHDLFEGLHGRVGLASDIMLLEGFPDNPLAHSKRAHRWIRGDWQLLPWLAPRVPLRGGRRGRSRFSLIDRWKIYDNLCRSLFAPAAFVAFLMAWLAFPGEAWAWSLAVLLATLLPVTLSSVHALGTGIAQGGTWRAVRERLRASLEGEGTRAFFLLAFLPYQALMAGDAIVRTCWRVFVSRRHLLQWVAAEETTRRLLGTRLGRFYREMWAAPAASVAVTVVLSAKAPTVLWSAGPLLLLWLFSPWIARRSARPDQPSVEDRRIDDEHRLFARRVALHTWSFFERFAGPDNHWLPPDNYHEAPQVFVSSRTSPTNIGLMLLASIGAHDLGYQGISTLLPRLRHALDSLTRLERYRGHFLNWYRLDDLTPLEPRYVSSVDSGNLAASLLVLRTSLQGILDAPYSCDALHAGLVDMLLDLRRLLPLAGKDAGAPRTEDTARLDALIERVESADQGETWADVLDHLEQEGLPALVGAALGEVRSRETALDTERIGELRRTVNLLRRHVHACRHELSLVPWRHWPRALLDGAEGAGDADARYRSLLESLEQPHTLRALPAACRDADARLAEIAEALGAPEPPPNADGADASENAGPASRLQQMRAQLGVAAAEATRLTAAADGLSRDAGELFAAMDFSFLFDRQRRLLRIGYSVTTSEYDPNFYDLLASEARLGSYVAIAKGDVPREHWLYLGRPLTRIGSQRALVSWSATAFEYLMPHLLMRAPPQTLIRESCEVAIAQQRRFAGEHGVPWGISESGFYQLDKQGHYQYRAFGVPELGLRLEADYRMVIAPYASALALPFSPRKVLDNLRRLAELGAFGRYGFFEAVDFGREPRRAAGDQRGRIVRSYMSHHQGMILVALVNALHDDVFIRRFHEQPLVASCNYLLYEHIQTGAAPPIGWRERLPERAAAGSLEALPTWNAAAAPELASQNVLCNEHYQVLINQAGISGSFWNGLCLTRWQNDPCEFQGSCLYVRDLESNALWSAGYGPIASRNPADCSAYFSPHMAEFHRGDHGINTHLSVAVCGRDDVEVRLMRLHNDTDRPRRLLLVSYAEPVLAPLADHERHPGFNKLFVETRAIPSEGVLLARRRIRDAQESPLYLGQTVCRFGGGRQRLVFLTDREAFLGRAGTQARPAALAGDIDLPAMQAPVPGGSVDPVMVLGIEIELGPRTVTEAAFVTGVGRRRADVLQLLASYRSAPKIRWAFHRAEVHSQRLLSELGIPSRDTDAIQALHSAVMAVHPALRPPWRQTVAGGLQPLLWSRSISGDLPILMLQVRGYRDVELAEELIRIHLYWDRQQVAVDLVLLDSEIGSYEAPARTRLNRLLESSRERWRHYTQGSVYVVPAGELSESDRNRLAATAWLVLDPQQGTIRQQLAAAGIPRPELPPFVPVPSSPVTQGEAVPVLERDRSLVLDNGLGGFEPDGGYSILLEPGSDAPAPWCNVIANPRLGCVMSERGAMCTWSGNSGEHRLSPWHNDPVRDPSGECLYLRDEETGAVWSPLPQPLPADAPYRMIHRAGQSIAEHVSHGLRQETRVSVDTDDPVKIVTVRLDNLWRRARRLTVTYYLEWVLGTSRRVTAPYVACELDRDRSALLARNAFSGQVDRTAFVATSETLHGFASDRREFLGLGGEPGRPAALERIGLSGEIRNGGDPCAVLQVHVDLPPMAHGEVCFLVGEGDDAAAARQLISRYRDASERAASLERVREQWHRALTTLQVDSPDPGFDLMVNHWLLYQTIACRLWARTATYQSGGGFGFRDQLQDVMALAASQPAVTRQQILRAAATQFTQGDVLHWWHEEPLRGVRTRCSDDLLWLVFATAHYVRTTGDDGILGERIPYLDAPELSSDEGDRYAEFPHTEFSETLFGHCRRAVERAGKLGSHGLPLMGSGDWNDGLNRIGAQGRGESVWLGWFLVVVYRDFAWLAEAIGSVDVGRHYRAKADALAAHVDQTAWDGDWYLRAYDDDGVPLGTADADECRIDLNAQTWAVMAAPPDAEHTVQAMEAVERLLAGDGLYRLLAPPFEHTERDPGYIKGYPPGVRENGAQYSHAAVWAGWAYTLLGDGEGALRVFHSVSPVEHSTRDPGRYRVEPYAVAADIYGVGPLTGRGGWTWYTGAAGWLYRLAVEGILGLRRRGSVLEIEPCLPQTWEGFQATWRLDGTEYRITVERAAAEAAGILLDGQPLETPTIQLEPDAGSRQVVVRIARG